MIDHVQQIAVAYSGEIALAGLVVVIAAAMRAYGRHLERRTREHSATRTART